MISFVFPGVGVGIWWFLSGIVCVPQGRELMVACHNIGFGESNFLFSVMLALGCDYVFVRLDSLLVCLFAVVLSITGSGSDEKMLV